MIHRGTQQHCDGVSRCYWSLYTHTHACTFTNTNNFGMEWASSLPKNIFFLMSLQNLPALCDGKEKKSTGRSASWLNLRRKAEGAAASYSAIVVCMHGKKSRLSCCKSSTFGNARTLLHILHMHRLFKTLIISFAPCIHSLHTLTDRTETIGWAVFTVETDCSKAVWPVSWLCAMLQKQ